MSSRERNVWVLAKPQSIPLLYDVCFLSFHPTNYGVRILLTDGSFFGSDRITHNRIDRTRQDTQDQDHRAGRFLRSKPSLLQWSTPSISCKGNIQPSFSWPGLGKIGSHGIITTSSIARIIPFEAEIFLAIIQFKQNKLRNSAQVQVQALVQAQVQV